METMRAGSAVFSFLLLRAFCPLCFYHGLWANIFVDDEQEMTSWKQAGDDPQLIQRKVRALGPPSDTRSEAGGDVVPLVLG